MRSMNYAPLVIGIFAK